MTVIVDKKDQANELTEIDLLKEVLVEMRVQTIYLHQLPLVLNAGTNFEDEPEKLREETSNEK